MTYYGSVYSEQYKRDIIIELKIDSNKVIQLEKIQFILDMNKYETFNHDIKNIKMVINDKTSYMHVEVKNVDTNENLKILLTWTESSRSFNISIVDVDFDTKYTTHSLFNSHILDYTPMDAIVKICKADTITKKFTSYFQFIMYVVEQDGFLFNYFI